MVRFNSFSYFSKIFFRERSNPPPPNFAPSFCALCLNVCDFLPKTWDLGRKITSSDRAPLPSAPVGRSHLPQGDGSPSQALPRQLSRRESQAVGFVAKVLGATRKPPGALLPLPLGEVDANAVSRRRGRGRSPPRDCFHRKPARQLPFAVTTPPVKIQSRAARRLPDFALIINNSSAEYG